MKVQTRRTKLYLVVNTGVGHNQQTGLQELLLTLVGQRTGSVTTSNVVGAGVLGELEHGTLTVRTARDSDNILRVLNGNDHTGSQHQLLPGLAQVDQVHT